MSDSILQQAFDDCANRLANGQTIEDCMAIYPQLAGELRPLLIAATAPSRLRADAGELDAMRSRLDAGMEDLLAETNFSQPSRLPTGAVTLAASLIIVFIGIGVVFMQNRMNTGSQTSPTPMVITPEATTEMTARPAATDSAATPSTTGIPQQIATPLTTTPSPEVSCIEREDWPEYLVQTGDTLSFIAVNSGTTVDTLQAANCLEDDTLIVAGTTIRVPQLWQQSNSSEDGSGINTGSGTDGNNPPGSMSNDDNDDDDRDEDDDDDSEDDDSEDDD